MALFWHLKLRDFQGLAGGEGFEPSTPNLGGWCSIRTELLAQFPVQHLSKFIGCYNSNVQMSENFQVLLQMKD